MSVKTISPIELLRLKEANKPIELIDVRTPLEYREVHVDCACNIPLDALDPPQVMMNRHSANDAPLYVLCRSGGRAKQACEKFITAGYPNVVNVEGGTLACIEAGLPVVRGKKVFSLERQVRITAGLLVLLGVALGFLAHPVLFWLSAFVGAGLIFAGITDSCPMALLIAKMPWNGDHKICSCDGLRKSI
ncbi:MAG: rhodanese-like domain-containing protein [Pirellulales bacterium]|nr:rhodanese-like domain-containing protein [Pirellulales bacterium]